VDLMSSLRRRWKLTCTLLLLTLVMAGVGWKKIPTTYQSVSSIVLLAPPNAAKAYGGNPYLAFNATLNQTADVVRYETNDTRTADALKAQGYSSSYLVTDAIDTSGPVLIVTVTGSNQALVEYTLHGVTSEVSARLDALQAGLTPGNKISDVVITFTPQASPLRSKKEKPLALLLALGIVLTICIPVAVDARSARRAPRNEALEPEHTEPARPVDPPQRYRHGDLVPGREPRPAPRQPANLPGGPPWRPADPAGATRPVGSPRAADPAGATRPVGPRAADPAGDRRR
jgi:hypothetical protein